MSIPIFSLKKQHEKLHKSFEAAFQRVLTSGAYVLGPEVSAWESEFSNYMGVSHAVGVSNGSDALLLALQALGVGPGDEVVLPTYTFFASAGSVARLGARPVFVDSAPCCYNLNVSAVANAIGPRTKAIMAVHLFGHAADMEALAKVASRAGIPIVEDVAQSLGAKVGSRFAGTIGALGCFSFFPTKNLGALGEGGMVVTQDAHLAEKVRKLRVHGAGKKYFHEYVGGNYRLHELQAAFLRVKLPLLGEWLNLRTKNAASYSQRFLESGIARFPTDACVCEKPLAVESEPEPGMFLPYRCLPSHTYNQFVIRVLGKGKRDLLKEFLCKKGIGSEVYYPRPLHIQDCFHDLGYRVGQFPWAEKFARETLALPIYPELEADELEQIATEVGKFISNPSKN